MLCDLVLIAVVASGIAAQKAVASTYQLCRFVCPDVIGPIPFIDEVLKQDGSAVQCGWFGNGFDFRGASFDSVSILPRTTY